MGILGIVLAYVFSLTFALVAIAAGVVGWLIVPPIIHDMVIDNVVLKTDTIQFERFETLPFPLDFKVYLFTITNADELHNGAKPVVKEIGPYVYNQYVTRIMTNIDENTLEYYEEYHYEFNEELSVGSQDDEVIVLHAALNSYLQVAEVHFGGMMNLINAQLLNIFGVPTMTLTTTVRELLFDGVPFCMTRQTIVTDMVCSMFINFDIPSVRPNGPGLAFSFFHDKNSTLSGPFIVDRGLQDSDDLGKILSYRGATSLPNWLNYTEDTVSPCNMINGTDAAIYRPHVDEDDTLLVFNSDICRSVKLHFQREVNYKGIRGLRYVAGKDMMDNTNRTCFCVNEVSGFHQDEKCLFDGALDLFGCQNPLI